MYECPLIGHPDKTADLISDLIVDHHININRKARVACEVMVSKNKVFVAGEIDDFDRDGSEESIRLVLKDLGYCEVADGISSQECEILFSVSSQSKNLKDAIGIDMNAGDQAIVVGYATNAHESLISPVVYFGKRLASAMSYAPLVGRRPDGKIFVNSVKHAQNINSIGYLVVSSQHDDEIEPIEYGESVKEFVRDCVGAEWAIEQVIVNPPNGRFSFGGPAADVGLTGRKLIAESYGPHVPHGGGALSGKDPSKIDRTGAYAARLVARSIVSAGVLNEATVFISYMIGERDPLDVVIWDGSQERTDVKKIIVDKLDLSLGYLIEFLELERPIFKSATENYHYGLSVNAPWETKLFEF